MALTRKFLIALGVEADKVDEIISAHTETVNGLKAQIDAAGDDAKALETAKSKITELDGKIAELEKQIKAADSDGWQKKYNEVKGEYDTYKSGIEAKTTRAAKETAYKKLLLDSGISDKRVDAVLKVSRVDDVTLADDGTIKDADKLTETIKSEWADFIVDTHEGGGTTPNPPGGDGSSPKTPSRAAQLVAQYRASHYGSKEE